MLTFLLLLLIIRSSHLTCMQQQRPVKYQECPAGNSAIVKISALDGSVESLKDTYSTFSLLPCCCCHSHQQGKRQIVNTVTCYSEASAHIPQAKLFIHHLHRLCHCYFIFRSTPFPPSPLFSSRAGLNMLTLCAAEELKKDEILFSLLHPGWECTDMHREVSSHQFFTDLTVLVI